MQDDGDKACEEESVHTDLDSKQPLEALEIDIDLQPKPKEEHVDEEQNINTIEQVLASLNQEHD